ncbi:MAG: phytoene/squalene synthase family protein [Parvularculaceae bacterium]|nr:phytoene/squalene synthase family protein [Parvularculaceae bacterium]
MTAASASPDREALSAYGRETIAKGSKSFALASLLFGREMQADAQMLYAWCRWCDDVVDGQTLGGDAPDAAMTREERAERLGALRRDTARALSGESVGEPAFDAFGEVARRHQLPRRYCFDLLDGFAMDAEATKFRSLDDTLRYCYGVAGVVGVMMAILMGVDRSDEETLDRACDLGLAFQLTNICRDVLDDARADRIYIPADILRAESVEPEPEAVLDPVQRENVWRAAVRVLDIADAYYASASFGVRRLPLRAAAAVAAARNVYSAIGGKIRAGGPAVWDQRVAVSGRRKAALALLGVATSGPAAMFLRKSAAPPREGLWSRSAIRRGDEVIRPADCA